MSTAGALAPAPAGLSQRGSRPGRLRAVLRAERRKLTSQLSLRVLALVCVIGPFAFAALANAQGASPTDSLFGAWIHYSGFAVSLVVLGFAGSWGLPVMAGVLAGDMFSAEDRHGTWKTVLTRSRSRGELFAGKLMTAAGCSVGLVALTAISSLAAGLLLVGHRPAPGLDGTLLSSGGSLWRVIAAWATMILPTLAFTSLALLLSIATRSGIAGVIGPALVALVCQLLDLVGRGVWVHAVLIGTTFDGWEGLVRQHPYFRALGILTAVSVGWIIACVALSWLILRRREFAGATSLRRGGWVAPVRTVAVAGAVIALLAVASNWGPTGVTAKRLKASLTPAFERLTLLQQAWLGRDVPAGAKLDVLPYCSRRASSPTGPGDWICTLNVYIPQPGAVPFQQTPVTYDLSVRSDGCYKAESPPSFVGRQTMRAASGHQVVNPLFVIYGCFDPFA